MKNVNHYLALYRKYRPENFEDVAGQSMIVKILKNSFVNGKISHAYLFSGPRGTGKTTIAKLFAKIVNCSNTQNFVPCGECDSCVSFTNKNNPDIIEIDAASNNGVDEIREIRDKVSLMPTFSKYKVYIIDEVHMLSIGAFNALLKTLEEPPQHVIFILATTEFYKVPETIVSRCQCFEFERVAEKDIISRLKFISEQEKINIDEDVFSLIAKYSDGGMRDAISLLDKLSCCSNNITKQDFYDLKGIVDDEDFELLFDHLISGNITALLDELERVLSNGKNVVLLCENFLVNLKNRFVKDFNGRFSSSVYFELLDLFSNLLIEMKSSSYPRILFEVGLLKACKIACDLDQDKMNLNQKVLKDDNKSIDVEDKEKQKEPVLPKLIDENRLIRINNAFAGANKKFLSEIRNLWTSLNNNINNEKFSFVISYLLDCVVRVVSDDVILLSTDYDSIVDQIHFNVDKIEELLNISFNKKYKVVCVTTVEWNNLKQKYIEDKNNGIIYKYKLEKNENHDIIKNEISNSNGEDEMVSSAFDLFGNEIIEYE